MVFCDVRRYLSSTRLPLLSTSCVRIDQVQPKVDKSDGFHTKTGGFILKLVDFILKLIDLILKLMDFIQRPVVFILTSGSPASSSPRERSAGAADRLLIIKSSFC